MTAEAAGSEQTTGAFTTVEEVIRHRLAVALGGWRGALETALPTAVFVALWLWRGGIRTAVIAAVGVAVVLAAARLVQRSSLQHVMGAVFATAIAAFFALRSGKAEDAFLPGLLMSAGWGSGPWSASWFAGLSWASSWVSLIRARRPTRLPGGGTRRSSPCASA